MTTATPLHFAHGAYGALANGHVTEAAPQESFTIAVHANQVMIISFTGAGPMRGSIVAPGGEGGDGPFYGNGDTYTFPVTGTYTINVGANTMAGVWTGGFTLAVLVTNQTATPQ